MQDNFDATKEFVKHIKKHSFSDEGPINNVDITRITNYSIRHFGRIFNNYSTLTPFEYSERFRLLQCVEYIQKGNTLKNAAIQYGYTPEGLSNAIKVNLGLSVEKIRKEDFELKKDIILSSMWKRIDNFKLQYDKDIFFSFMESLDKEKILKYIEAEELKDINSTMDNFDIVLDYKEVQKILKEADECYIEKQIYEDLNVSDSAIIYTVLQMDRYVGLPKLRLRYDEINIFYFIIGFFFNTEGPELSDGYYIFRLSDDIRAILSSLSEIEKVTNNIYDMKLHATIKENKVTHKGAVSQPSYN